MKHTIKLITISLLLSSSLSAQTKTFIRDYTYQASEDDSKNYAKKRAETQLQLTLLREVGTYIREEQILVTIGDKQEYIEKIEAFTAGIVEMTDIKEDWSKWEFSRVTIEAKMTVDPNEVEQKIKEIAGDKQKTKELEESRARTKAAEEEATRLRAEIAQLRKEKANEQKIEQKTNEYNKKIEILSAEEYYTKGNNAYDQGINW